MPDREELSAFVRSTFRSVWSFEIALLLKRRPGRWTEADIVTTLRASELIVSQSVENLSAGGLVDADVDGLLAYAPVNEAIAALLDGAEQLYESKPDHVRRLIATRETPGLTAFANAFRLRDEK